MDWRSRHSIVDKCADSRSCKTPYSSVEEHCFVVHHDLIRVCPLFFLSRGRPPPVALPSAQKITLVVLSVTSSHCERKLDSSWFFFSGGLSCVPLFFEPLFSVVSKFPTAPEFGTHSLDVPTYFLAHLQSSLDPLLLQLFLCSLSREFPAYYLRRERSKQPARCQVVAVTLRAFLDNIPTIK